jgi:methanethiol S-methyltransferase
MPDDNDAGDRRAVGNGRSGATFEPAFCKSTGFEVYESYANDASEVGRGEAEIMTRAAYLLVGIVCYLIFFTTFLYLIAFVGDFPFVPHTVNVGPETSLPIAVIVNLALIALFGLQHSVMARKGFKQAWTRIIPAPLERSVYVLFASVALLLLITLWRPIPGLVWQAEAPVLVYLLTGLFGLGWAIVLISTFLINHFELFGLSQVWTHARGAELAEPRFRTPLFYRAVRHPIYAGFIMAFWSTPTMTWGHLLLAAGMTVYVVIAIRHEERDLIGLYGDTYVEYRTRVGMLVPRFLRAR